MLFTKAAMQEELSKFLILYGKQIERLYGASDGAWITKATIEESVVWTAVSEMYDYGVTGIPTGDLTPGSLIDGAHAHIEKFFHAMDTPTMKVYLDEAGNKPPRLAIRAVQSAVARMVLDGGDRSTDFGVDVYGIGKGDFGYLTIAEVALLADMDERSVRNAANPKLPAPLKTEQVGKRSLIRPTEARLWLTGRKGFTPTQANEVCVVHRPPSWDVGISPELLEQIKKEAKESGELWSIYFPKRIISLLNERLKEV